MDESRVQAYVDLIQQLLACPSGEESGMLQAHRELLDAGFVATVLAVAAQAVAQGEENAARFLEDLAAQLGQALGLSTDDSQEPGVMEFLIQVLQTVSEKPDPQVLYPLLKANLDKVNLELAAALQALTDQHLSQFNPEQQPSVAAVIVLQHFDAAVSL